MPNYIGFGKGSAGNESAEKSLGVWMERSPVCHLCNGLINHPPQEETVRLNAQSLRAWRRRAGKTERKKKGRVGGREETILWSSWEWHVTDLMRLIWDRRGTLLRVYGSLKAGTDSEMNIEESKLWPPGFRSPTSILGTLKWSWADQKRGGRKNTALCSSIQAGRHSLLALLWTGRQFSLYPSERAWPQPPSRPCRSFEPDNLSKVPPLPLTATWLCVCHLASLSLCDLICKWR